MYGILKNWNKQDCKIYFVGGHANKKKNKVLVKSQLNSCRDISIKACKNSTH